MHRPAGVTILAVLSFLATLNMLLTGLMLLGASFLPQFAMLSYLFRMLQDVAPTPWGALALILQIPLNLIFVTYFLAAGLHGAIGFGLLNVQNWARRLIIALCILELIGVVVGYAVPRFFLLRLGILGMAIDVAALVFLFQPKVRGVFEAGAN